MEDTSGQMESGSQHRHGACWRCGEPLSEEGRAEVARVDLSGNFIEGNSVIVHAEPCAVEMLRDGWAIA
jgi:hypothetical protein